MNEKDKAKKELKKELQESVKENNSQVQMVSPRHETDVLKLTYELQVHQIELELQNHELILAQEQALSAIDKYLELYNFAPTAYFTISKNGKIIELNLNGAKMLGKDHKQLTNAGFAFFVSENAKSAFHLFLEKVFSSKTKQICEATLATNDSTTRFVQFTGIAAENGEKCFLTAVDITELNNAKNSLFKSEESFRKLLHTIPDMAVITDLEGNIIYANGQLFSLLNDVPEEKLYGKNMFSFIAEHDLSRAIENTKLMFKSPLGVREYQLNFEDKKIIDAEVNGDLIRDHDNNPTGIIFVIRDITRRKLTERALQQSEAKYRQLAESSTLIVYLLRLKPELQFEYVSPSVTAITGYTPEDHYSDPQLGFKLVHPDDRILLENTTRYSKGEPLELRWIRKDGQVIWTEQRNVLLFDENNEPYAIEGSATDITDKKNAEMLLRKEFERTSLLLDLFAEAPVLSDKELYDRTLDIAVKITESKIGFFHRISDNQQEIILTTWNDEARKSCTTVHDDHYSMDKAGNWADCVRQKKPIVYNDYPMSPNRKGLPEGHAPVGKIVSIPVVLDGKVQFIFGVGNKTTDYTGLDVVQIQAVANELHKILEKREVEKILQKSEDRWQFAIEGSNEGIWDWNILTGDVFFSNRWKEMLGFGPDELEGNLSEWENRVHPDDIDDVLWKLKQHFEQKTPDYSSEHRIFCKDGSSKWILDRGKILEWTSDGKPSRMVGTHKDISERKRAEENIRKSEEKFRIVADNAFNWEFWEGTDGKAIHHSPSCKKITGYSADEFMNDDDLMIRIIHPDDREAFAEHHLEKKTDPSPGRLLFRIINAKGEIRHIEHVCQPVFNDSNALIGIRGSNIDMTERKLIEDTRTFLLSCGLPGTGEDFFESLARYLAETLKMGYVCIDRLHGDGLTAQTVAIFNEGRFESNVQYALKDTPCGEVVDKSVCCYRRGVRHLFPNDAALQDLNAESYVGTTLLDSKGQAIGLIAIIGHQPLQEDGKAETLLKLVASRASGELERREAENALQDTLQELYKAKEKAEESDRLKSAFLANVSHEIRTPMNGILGFSYLLNEPGLNSEEQQEYVTIIQKSGTRMLNILNDVVDIAKIESGLVETAITEVNLNTQMEYVFKLLEPDAKAKNLKFSFENRLPVTEAIIQTDETKLYSILSNLVKNAIKYTDIGSIEFGCTLKGENVEFFVKDSGIGIPKKRQEAIFERFIQADIADVQARQGAGLGLSIAKAYADMLGGKIWVESEPDIGSTFYFTIPIS